ncbi:DUF3306 domain-containing protein [Mesorhizobium xinjiangense]|uniref:DUF3306 domain-containing protein n=1 Tax=Mesorhizobium xinjiangense TaxID=2678685 RepID=UPI0012EE136D|nr:DUF3306 domain-containing protein [Mesorhizobium xinjiangense]
MVEERKEAFLERWSRRKRKAGAAEHAASNEEPVTAPAGDAEPPENEAARAEMEANRRAAEAVDIDALEKGDDFSVFFRRGVPPALKNRALRKLWRTNPVLANLDGLNDYDTDFNAPSAKVYSSLWQVGRGYLDREQQEVSTLLAGDETEATPPAAAEQATASATQTDDESEELAAENPQEAFEPEGRAEAPSLAAEETHWQDDDGVTRPKGRVSIRRRLQG